MSFLFVAVALNKSSFTNYMPHLTILETNSSLLFSSYSTRVFWCNNMTHKPEDSTEHDNQKYELMGLWLKGFDSVTGAI